MTSLHSYLIGADSKKQKKESQAEYTCPMHPEVVQEGPGDCPKCGMALEPKAVAAEERVAVSFKYEGGIAERET